MTRRIEKGFTLFEFLIVLFIISIILWAMVPMFRDVKLESKIAKTQTDLNTIRTSALMLHLDTDQWPAEGDDGLGLTHNNELSGQGGNGGGDFIQNWEGPYLDSWQIDPWGISYQIYDPVGSTARRVRSCGIDRTCDTPDDIDILIIANDGESPAPPPK